MERSSVDQATDLLTRGQEILLLVSEEPSADAFTSTVGLGLALNALGKSATMISASHVPASLQFLPGTSQVHEVLERTSELVIDLPVGTVRAADVRWEQTGENVRIVLTPEKGKLFSAATPTVTAGRYLWDTIVTIGSPDLNHLGAPFTEHAPFFYETPILNIDRGTANEFFGTVNLVPAAAGTVAEVVYDLIDALGGVNLLTPEVATCLFAGILAGTHSFQGANTTPRAFAVAAALLEQNADRQSVVRQLFTMHTLPELRLLGRGLARMKEIDDATLWSVLTQKDFAESGDTPDDIPGILMEMVERAGGRTRVLLAFERSQGTLEVLVFPGKIGAEDRARIAEELQGTVAGQFVTAPLGTVAPSDAERMLRERVVPQLP